MPPCTFPRLALFIPYHEQEKTSQRQTVVNSRYDFRSKRINKNTYVSSTLRTAHLTLRLSLPTCGSVSLPHFPHTCLNNNKKQQHISKYAHTVGAHKHHTDDAAPNLPYGFLLITLQMICKVDFVTSYGDCDVVSNSVQKLCTPPSPLTKQIFI